MAKSKLEKELEKLKEVEEKLDIVLEQNKETSEVTKDYLQLLHEYNDVKDAAQVVMGALADLEGTTVSEIHNRFGMDKYNKMS